MTDPAVEDPVRRALAWIHPLWMVTSLLLAALTLRLGLRLRRARRARAPRRAERGRHLRLGKTTVTLALLGFLGGPLSMALLRGRVPFGTVHALFGVLAAALFLAAAVLGRRLERGAGASRDLHGALGVGALLAGALAAVMGFVLLP